MHYALLLSVWLSTGGPIVSPIFEFDSKEKCEVRATSTISIWKDTKGIKNITYKCLPIVPEVEIDSSQEVKNY